MISNSLCNEAALAVLLAGLVAAPIAGQRRTRRPRPTPVASRAGSQLPWQRDLDQALAEARRTRREIFWYVPTVPRSPMDRQKAIDLFMKAGFFSDPDLCGLLRQFVLLAKKPSRKEATEYDLRPFRFIEPGFLILDQEGAVLGRAHSITTFSPAWLARRLQPWLEAEQELVHPEESDPRKLARHLRWARLFGRPAAARKFIAAKRYAPEYAPDLAVQHALLMLGDGDAKAAHELLDKALLDNGDRPRVSFLRAACEFRLGRQDVARRAWRALAARHPEHPLGWRAAAEAEGFGPIARGFWIWRDLPQRTSKDAGTRVPFEEQDIAFLRRRSVEFLRAMQADHGGWEDSNYDFGGQQSLPNVWVAVSALCCSALFENLGVAPGPCRKSLERGLGYVLDPRRRNDRDRNEWIWAHVYPIDLVTRLLASDLDLANWPKERLRKELEAMVTRVIERQGRDGSFRHEYSNPFVTASVLIALDEARQQGLEPPAETIERAVRSLQRCRSQRGAFTYYQSSRGRRGGGNVKGSAGRMPLCEAALLAWGSSDRPRLVAALGAAFEHHDQLESTRKYDDHANSLAYGGFFFWYDMLGREFAFERLGDAAPPWRAKQRRLILQIPEIDGCFVDSHELGRSYGTAMALLCLRPAGR